jgi:hypothetical protein
MTQAESNFWSRRRAAVKAEEAAIVEAEAQRKEIDVAKAMEEKPDEVILEELGLKDPDLMQMGDDFSAFMQKAVPERLRRRALRKLWVSNPVLANLDGLVDHGEDYSDAATVIPDMKTTYQVGKGLLKHVLALAEEKVAPVPEPVLMDAPEIEEDLFEDAETPVVLAAVHEDEPEDPAPAPRRHMRFAFEN